MYKLVVVGAVLSAAYATYHPINEDIVKDIKSKTSHWTPMATTKNPLSKYSVQQLKGMMGTQITEPFGYAAP